jgi:DHA2 family multidrug resistance protein
MAAPADVIAGSERRWATAALMLATAMQAADATIVNVALPQLEQQLGGGIELGAWIMTSYLCAAAIVAPLTGWLRRRFGPRQLYATALALFTVASILCALAPSAAAIILFRALQGFGGGVIPALSQAVLHDLYPRERHGRILAIWGAVAMLGPILGPALGGIITDLSSWRCVFAINLPLGVLAIWGMRDVLPSAGGRMAAPFDTAGFVLLVAGIGALQLALQRGVGRSWFSSPELLAEAAIALAAFVATALRTRRTGPTILRLEVFCDRNFAASAFFNFTTSALLFTAIVFVPTLVQGPLGYPATIAGLTIVPRGIFMMLIILVVGRIIDRIDFRMALLVGSVLLAGGLGMLAEIGASDDLNWIVFGSIVQAIGAGAILMPLSTFAFATLPTDIRTDAAGLYSLLRQLGCASGVALMTAILQMKLATTAPPGVAAPPAAALRAYADCFTMMTIAALGVMPGILVFTRPRRHDG